MLDAFLMWQHHTIEIHFLDSQCLFMAFSIAFITEYDCSNISLIPFLQRCFLVLAKALIKKKKKKNTVTSHFILDVLVDLVSIRIPSFKCILKWEIYVYSQSMHR